MPWVIIDDAFSDDPRVLAVGHEGYGALCALIGYANKHLLDGYVPDAGVKREQIRPSVIRGLVDEGLLIRVDGHGYRLCDQVAGWQPTRERVERERAQKADRQKRWREARTGRVDASRDASHNGSRDGPRRDAPHPAPPRPAPKGQGAGAAPPPRCPHGKRLGVDGTGCIDCQPLFGVA